MTATEAVSDGKSWVKEKGFCQFEMNFICRSLSNNPSERYQTLGKLMDSIKECRSINQDKLLITGTEFKEIAKKSQIEIFCSTCEVNPSVIVSNGEQAFADIVEIDENSSADILFVDNNHDGQIDFSEAADTSSLVNDFATTCGGNWGGDNNITNDIDAVDFASPSRQRLDDFKTSIALRPKISPEIKLTFTPNSKSAGSSSFWSRIFGKKEKHQEVYSSVFAPAEVKTKSRMMVQVYLHLDEETEKVKTLATQADKNAERRDYIPLQTKLKKGDK